MQKYTASVLIAGILILVSGCQTSRRPALSNAYPTVPTSYAFSPQMNLAQSVQEALARSEDPIIAQVQVATSQNLVFLTGYVKKIRQSDVAEQIARQVPGVQNVHNGLIVRR